MGLESVKQYISYDESTGVFHRIKPCFGVKVGNVAGYLTNRGYIMIKFNGKNYLAHRLAWYFKFGYMPEKSIDHINGIKTDNRICNLREVTHSENMQNRKIHREGRHPGWSFHKQTGTYHAKVIVRGVKVSLGYHKTKEDAIERYKLFVTRSKNVTDLKSFAKSFKESFRGCKRGHLFTEENSLKSKNGVRRCKACYEKYSKNRNELRKFKRKN